LMDWIYRRGVGDFQQMSNFPKSLRQQLAERAVVGVGQVVARQDAPDGTMKLAIAYPEGHVVECVVLPYHHGITLCLSTQVGCKQRCAFCASGMDGFQQHLSTAEIVEQIWQVNQMLAPRDQRVGHLVYMGMGEPLDNYNAVLESVRLANNPQAFGIGIRNITISTSGLVPGIYRLADEGLGITLSISLHAPVDYLRDQIMPVNQRYPLADLMQAARYYAEQTKRRVTFEYILLGGFNDRLVHAQQLADLLRGLICHVNLIPYNPVADLPWQPPADRQVRAFAAKLEQLGIAVTVRRSLGPDIDAACGQLRRKLQREE
jgi:23S rRNA (adenine2503-C2)-methyltransferase